ncbi:hypothetical protein QN357_18600 [Cryobacterium sp. RTC2.1]|nr:hypothetical protein [Cryobacterium sp. RTC2.1]
MSLGSEVVLDGNSYLVVEIANARLTLRDLEKGGYRHLHVTELFMRGQLETVKTVPISAERDISTVATMNERANADAEFWREHIFEVIHGRKYSAGPNQKIRGRYDPAKHPQYRRIESKVRELTDPPFDLRVSARTIRRKIHEYETCGFAGLVDKRLLRREGPLNRADERVVEALQIAVDDQVNRSTVTRGKVVSEAIRELHRKFGNDVEIPHRSTVYRYLQTLSAGKETFGLATSRRSRARSPQHTYGGITATRPGEYVQIDATKMDVLALDEQGKECRVTVSLLVDVFTCSILAFVMRPEALKGVDQALLLARAFVPAPFRPHHSEQMQIAKSGLPAGVTSR